MQPSFTYYLSLVHPCGQDRGIVYQQGSSAMLAETPVALHGIAFAALLQTELLSSFMIIPD